MITISPWQIKIYAGHLHPCGDEERRDHDGAACQEVRVGVQERGESEVGHDEVVEPAVGRLVHGCSHRAAEKG